MSVFDICNDQDAVEVLLASDTWSDVRCVGWPKLVIDTSNPFHPMRNNRRLQAIQEAVERQVCLLLHGTTDRRYLLGPEKAAAQIEADYSPDKRKLVLDFSGPANAVLRLVREKAKQASGWKQGWLFRDEGWQKGVGDAARILAHKVDAKAAERILTKAAIVGLLMLGTLGGLKLGGDYHLDRRQQNFDHQTRMTELSRTTIIRRDGSVAHETAKVKAALREEEHKVALLTNLELEHPLIGFVAQEGRRVAPMVLGLAPPAGRLSFAGMEMEAKEARGLAKALREVERGEKANGRWETKVIRS